MDNQKDHINANEFYALEMKAYKEVLKNKSLGSFYQEKIVFYLHDFTSNFGQDWLKPILLLILLTMGEVGIQLVPNIYIQQLVVFSILITPIAIAIKLLTILLKLPLPLPSLETLILSIFGIAGFSAYIHTNPITNFLETFNEILNLFGLFSRDSKNLIEFKSIHLLYAISVAVLTYQTIIAIRRKVKR